MRSAIKKLLSRSGYRELVLSQIILYVAVIVCIVLAPGSLGKNEGLSYFGHHPITILPFGAGLLLSAFYVIKGASHFKSRPKVAFFGWLFPLMAGLMAGIVAAPAVGDGFFDLAHRIFGSILFVCELLLAFWLLKNVRGDRLNWLIFGFQWLGGIIAAIYLSPAQGFSIEGQLLFQVSFSVLLMRSLTTMATHPKILTQSDRRQVSATECIDGQD
ncbi:MAG TPA: hypothetical protein VFW90_02150 [Candidatus Saccharimonadales bacterium]|nr:hypothetical protein [Candidatus Saccharimonadales bacterium]